MARHLVPALLLTLILLSAGRAAATVVRPLSLSDQTARSHLVAHVRVGQIMVVSTEQAPFRVTRLDVVEVLRGDARAGDQLDLWQRGDGASFVVGDPWLETGQEGLAFLVREGGRVYLTALAQSWWQLEQTGQGQIAVRDLTGLHVVAPPTPVVVPPDRLRWADLRQRVLAACARHEADR